MSDYTHRGARIRRARTGANISQVALATSVGVHPNQIRRYEAGIHAPRSPILFRIAASLGVTPCWLETGHACAAPRGVGD